MSILSSTATEITPEVNAEILDMFECHEWSEQQVRHGAAVRNAFERAVGVIINYVSPGLDRSVAIRKLREAQMGCNSAITHCGKH